MDAVLGFPDHPPSSLTESSDFIETPLNRDWADLLASDTPNDHAGEQLKEVSNRIGKTLTEIAAGKSAPEYPAIDAILKKHDYRAAKLKHEEELYERIYGEKPQSPEDMEPQRQVLISDVKPTPKERIYSLERDMQDVSKDLSRLENVVARYDERAANKDDVRSLEARFVDKVNHAHLRLDRDVVPAIKEVASDVKKLNTRRVFKDIVLVISLSVSIIVNVIVLYHYVVKP